MKNLALFLFLLVTQQALWAQEPAAAPQPDNQHEVSISTPDTPPYFTFAEDACALADKQVCALKEMYQYLYERIEYPPIAQENGVEGRVLLGFEVSAKGQLSNFTILRDPGAHTGRTALAAAETMQNAPWVPGTQDGKRVAYTYELPIVFKLNDGKFDRTTCIELSMQKHQEHQPKVVELVVPGEMAPPPPPPMPAQPPVRAEQKVYKVVNTMPMFPTVDFDCGNKTPKICAQTAMLTYIYRGLNYPEQAREDGIEGMAIIRFIVRSNGELTDFELYRDPGAGLGAEALRVIKSMSDMPHQWSPGRHFSGEAVDVEMTIPVKFNIE